MFLSLSFLTIWLSLVIIARIEVHHYFIQTKQIRNGVVVIDTNTNFNFSQFYGTGERVAVIQAPSLYIKRFM